MEEKQKCIIIAKNINNDEIDLNLTKSKLNDKIKKKMKNYKITNFHFILDKINDNIKERNVSHKINEEKNKNIFTISNKSYLTNNHENFIEILNNNNYNKFEKNEVIKDGTISSNKNENIDNINKYSKIFDKISILNEQEIISNNEKNLDMIEIGTQTCNSDNIGSEEDTLINPKEILLKLIKKYSYQIVFNVLLQNCSNKYMDDNYYDEDVCQQLEMLIKDIGIQNVIKNILLIGNSRNEYVQYPYKNKMENEISNIYFTESDNDYTIYIVGTNENNYNYKIINKNDMIILTKN